MDELHKRIFISTQPEEGFPELVQYLNHKDVSLFNLPMIEVCEAEISEAEQNLIKKAEDVDWIIFTSKNGVQFFLKKYEKIAGKIFEKGHSKIAVIGKKTGKELQKAGIEPDYISESNLAEKFVVELMQNVISERSRVLLMLGNLASNLIETELAGWAEVSRVNCYQTSQPKVKNTELIHRIFSNEYDLIIFTSSSGFENFVSITKEFNIDLQNVKAASIGKSTTKTMNDFGVSPVFTAQQSNLEGIANEIKYIYKLKA